MFSRRIHTIVVNKHKQSQVSENATLPSPKNTTLLPPTLLKPSFSLPYFPLCISVVNSKSSNCKNLHPNSQHHFFFTTLSHSLRPIRLHRPVQLLYHDLTHTSAGNPNSSHNHLCQAQSSLSTASYDVRRFFRARLGTPAADELRILLHCRRPLRHHWCLDSLNTHSPGTHCRQSGPLSLQPAADSHTPASKPASASPPAPQHPHTPRTHQTVTPHLATISNTVHRHHRPGTADTYPATACRRGAVWVEDVACR